MATFTFDGTASQTVAFNATVDRAVINLDVAEVASLSEDRANNTVTIVATSGAVLTLTNTNFAAFTSTSLVAGFDSNIVFGIGTTGDDTTAVNGNVAVGLAGNDTFAGTAGNDLLFGNAGNDIFTGTTGSSRIYGGQGNDQINVLTSTTSAAAQTSLLVGGLGEDTIIVAGTGAAYAGNATIFGGNEAGDPTDGVDNISVTLSETGTATIFGNGGDDNITVLGGGSASVYGGQGGDEIFAQVNTGLFVGGLGADRINVSLTGTDASATIFGGNGAADAVDGNDTISVFADDGASASIYGNGGNDIITAEGGASFEIFGGQGNDQIGGELGDGSVVYGGLGIDAINVSASGTGAAITVFGGNGDADAADSADSITVNLTTSSDGSVGGITVPGVDQTAVIYGNGGNDIVSLTGSGGAATVFGGAGDDTINVNGGGQYVLTGGAGDDTFNFSGAGATTTEAGNLASITDFTGGDDVIDFAALVTVGTVANATLASALNIEAIINAGGSEDGQVAVITVTGGDLAGSYAVHGSQAVEITGFTGALTVASFGGVAIA